MENYLIILQKNTISTEFELDMELSRFHKMINEGVLLIDARYKEPIILDCRPQQEQCFEKVDND